MTGYSSSEMDEELSETRVHSQRSAAPAHVDEMGDDLSLPARERRGQKQTANNLSTHANARLDRGQACLQQSAAPAHYNETSQSVTSPARGDRGELARTYELNARSEHVPAHLLESATAAYHDRDAPTTSASANMAHTKGEGLPKDQSTCTLFRLPPELRNTIYTYVAYSKFSLPQFEWDEEHNSPKLDLGCAQQRAPSDELLRTCRSIHDESEGIFVRAKTQFWSDTTFTLALPTWPLPNSFHYLECLTDDQVNHMTRVNIFNIDKHSSQLFTVHLRSGPEAVSSVTYSARPAGCNRRSFLPVPLSVVEHVVARILIRQLSSRDVYDILWHTRENAGCPSVPFCVEHQWEPVVLSLRNLNRAGLMGAVRCISHGPRCC